MNAERVRVFGEVTPIITERPVSSYEQWSRSPSKASPAALGLRAKVNDRSHFNQDYAPVDGHKGERNDVTRQAIEFNLAQSRGPKGGSHKPPISWTLS